MDFFMELPTISDYAQIWVIVGRLSKVAHFVPLKSRTAPTLFFFFFFFFSLNPAFANRHGRGANTYPDPKC